MQGGGASVHSRSLFHQTITTGNTDKPHLLMCDAVGLVVCEGSPEKNNQRLGSIQRDGQNVFLENVGVLSARWWWWCGVWGTGYMLDAVIVLGLLSNPRPWALKQPTPSLCFSLSFSVCLPRGPPPRLCKVTLFTDLCLLQQQQQQQRTKNNKKLIIATMFSTTWSIVILAFKRKV